VLPYRTQSFFPSNPPISDIKNGLVPLAKAACFWFIFIELLSFPEPIINTLQIDPMLSLRLAR
jgi:hypothetical protein